MITDTIKRDFPKLGVEQGLKTMASISGERSVTKPKPTKNGSKSLKPIGNSRELAPMMLITRTAFRKT